MEASGICDAPKYSPINQPIFANIPFRVAADSLQDDGGPMNPASLVIVLAPRGSGG
jgi:hypothetical protein